MNSAGIRLKDGKSPFFRAWHWTNAFVILSILATVVLRDTYLNARENAEVIRAVAQSAGQNIPEDLAREMGRAIRDPMWEWHYLLGYALAGLMIGRIFLALFSGRRPVRDAIVAWRGFRSVSGGSRRSALHLPLLKSTYVFFYFFLLLMVSTGLPIRFARELGIAKATTRSIREVHETGMWFVAGFVVLHLLGVIVAELTRYPGLISNMIHGKPDSGAE